MDIDIGSLLRDISPWLIYNTPDPRRSKGKVTTATLNPKHPQLRGHSSAL